MPSKDVCFGARPSLLCRKLGLQIRLVVVFSFISLSDCFCAGTRVSVEEPAIHARDDGGGIILGEAHAVGCSGSGLLRPARAVEVLEKPLLRDNIFRGAHQTATSGSAKSAPDVHSRLILEVHFIGFGLGLCAVHWSHSDASTTRVPTLYEAANGAPTGKNPRSIPMSRCRYGEK